MSLDRFTRLFKAFVDAVLGRLEDPTVLLEQHYHSLQAQLILVRQELAQAIANEAQLKRKMEDQEGKGFDKDALAVELKAQAVKIEKLKKRLDELEQEIQKTYTKQQVLRARNKANQVILDTQRHMSDHLSALNTIQSLENLIGLREPPKKQLAFLLGIVTLIWLLICLYVTLRHLHIF